jgi:hypothetical protein
MKLLKIALAATALALAAPAFAADLPAKAPPPLASLFNTTYPYQTSGLFFGVYTEGGGGSVNGTVAGVSSASLTETSAGVGGTVGYAWGQKNSPVALSVEADFGWTNINGDSAGVGLSGPASFEQRFVIFTPLASALSMLQGLPNLGTIPPFVPLSAGVTATNLQVGFTAGLDENDISSSFPGLSSNQEWRVAPMIGLVAMEQLSNGMALRSWIKTVFPEKGVCVGPVSNACSGLGQQIKVGAGLYF